MSGKALVKNAASEKQVKKARESEDKNLENEEKDLLKILSLPEGRRFAWRILGHCGLYRSPYAHSGSEQNKNIGMGEVGRWFLAEIVQADPVVWLKIQEENLKKGELNV